MHIAVTGTATVNGDDARRAGDAVALEDGWEVVVKW